MRELQGDPPGSPCTASGGTMAQDLHDVGVRVEELLAELASVADPGVHEKAEALVSLLVEFYGAGLERVLALVGREPSGELIVRRLAQDDLLASLFVLHGIHPVPVEDRVHEAIQALRPQLGGTRVALIAIDDDGVAHCELSPGGCGSAPVDLARTTVEKAVLAVAPEITTVTFGVVAPPPAEPGPVAVEIGRSRRVPVEIGRKPGPGAQQ
ncbi:MAG TPA: NifU family protein [Acidimicrobiia bacterium]|nr:NifU family protein [Acidimicrobiia bacterium]